ncbi:MAG: hypothetical protein LLG02_01455 [Pelosinus sp.]|nr:hypothetical protein [Pelosinus sp.]
MTRENAILTFTNTLFYPLEPAKDEVKVEDIAHALSQMCRANGHFKTFYSVAQHSINCANEAKARGLSVRVQLACLLHDASEAYISDITRPVKCYLHEYRKIEHRLQQVIFSHFGVADQSEAEKRQVDDIDNALLYFEFEQLHNQGICENPPRIYSRPDVALRNMITVEAELINLAKYLLKEIEKEQQEFSL